MPEKIFGSFLAAVCFASFVSLAGCSNDMQPEGPQMGELEAYLNEHPELMETQDEEMDYVEEGDEFADAEADG